MPRIQWTGLPPALRDHLFDRLRERKITRGRPLPAQNVERIRSRCPRRALVQGLRFVQNLWRRKIPEDLLARGPTCQRPAALRAFFWSSGRARSGKLGSDCSASCCLTATKSASISSDVTHLSPSFDAAAATPLIPFSMKSDASLVPSISVMHSLESCRASATAARVKALVVIKIPFAVELSAPRNPLISTLPTACRQRLTCAWTLTLAEHSGGQV